MVCLAFWRECLKQIQVDLAEQHMTVFLEFSRIFLDIAIQHQFYVIV